MFYVIPLTFKISFSEKTVEPFELQVYQQMAFGVQRV